MIKYQIFVSSTYEDLKDERAQIIKAVLEMGHIPVGMEMFSAADEEQWKIIARQIDEADYYVVVVGNRYGSVAGGVSYTEKEFDYAVSKGIPVLGFVIDPSVESLAKNVDTSEEKIAALAKFKAKVKQRPVGFWRSYDELHGKVAIALMKAFHISPRTGWTRATGVAGPEVMQELSRLSKENADLRGQLAAGTQQEAADRRAHLQSRIETLKSIPQTILLREKGKSEWEIEVRKTLFDIFEQLAPEMMVEISVSTAGTYLSVLNRPRKDLELTKHAPIPINHISEFFTNLASLGLVEPSKKKHPVADKEAYWSLTEEGADVLKLCRATRFEAAPAKALATSQTEAKPVKRASRRKAT